MDAITIKINIIPILVFLGKHRINAFKKNSMIKIGLSAKSSKRIY